ncbi:MAG: secondary thiamine-phosphate synthase enzyme YjbQ [Caldisericia bacterium]|nr:secondary thiamine-phosphate synthase enzyme YjbQ [Caldisericia bacterium]
MKTKVLYIKSRKRVEAIDITDQVLEFVKESEVRDGVLFIYVPHTTAGLTINENADPSVIEDILNKASELVPRSSNYKHLEGNADSHIKSSIFGISHQLLIEDGRVILGTWQGIFFLEFDGPRERKVYLKILKNE